MIGQRLGHYEVLEKLGEGGMGAVYRALDTTLDRKVALKVLPTEVSEDADRLGRFEREAKALAALNHPNIVTIHTVESAGGIHFLTMELVEGQPLGQMIPAGGMSLDRFFETAIPLADALAAAHEKGIIHRDLKPANVMVTHDGRLKILDFGLAKLLQGPKDEADLSEMLTEPMTQEGLVVGTLPYMSPEQLEGADLDARSDIFSLGIVLYEMATGQRPFRGESSVALLSAIVKDSPEEVDQLREDLPHQLGRIVRHCLAKSPESRFQTARDVRNELADLRLEEDTAESPEAARHFRRRLTSSPLQALGLLGALVILASIALWWIAPWQSVDDTPITDTIAPPRIVILPFENLGPPEDEYFADGITEAITSRLSAASGLRVISRTTAMQYKEGRPPLTQIGQDLDVDYALEGTVLWDRTSGDSSRVRITPQLILLPDDSHLWSESYDRVVDDIFEIQSDLAQQVLTAMNLHLADQGGGETGFQPTESLEAYQAYLQGKHLLRQPHFTLESWNQALATLERAVEIDPAFALAWAELARAHSRLIYFKVDPSEQRLSKAGHAIEQASAGNSDSPDIHLAAGYYYLWALRDAAGAVREFRQAAQEIPDNTDLLEGLGEAARLQGQIDEAIIHFRQAAELSPLDASPKVELGLSLWWARRYEEALQACDQAAVLAPNHAWPYITKAMNYWSWRGESPEARTALEAVSYEHPWMPWLWYWQELYESRYAEGIERLASSDDEWITLKICIRPKPLLRSYAFELWQQPDFARSAAEEAVTMLEGKLQENPDEARLHSSLGIALALLGRQEEAIREGRQGVDLFPLSVDAIYAQIHIQDLAHIYTLVGDHDSACSQLTLLLSIPGWITVELLETDPRWAPLRDQPCYQELLKSSSKSP